MTYTFATLEISAAAYDEIRGKLQAAWYDHAFTAGPAAGLTAVDDPAEIIDMHGIGLVCADAPAGGTGPDPSEARRTEWGARAIYAALYRDIASKGVRNPEWEELSPANRAVFVRAAEACALLRAPSTPTESEQ